MNCSAITLFICLLIQDCKFYHDRQLEPRFFLHQFLFQQHSSYHTGQSIHHLHQIPNSSFQGIHRKELFHSKVIHPQSHHQVTQDLLLRTDLTV